MVETIDSARFASTCIPIMSVPSGSFNYHYRNPPTPLSLTNFHSTGHASRSLDPSSFMRDSHLDSLSPYLAVRADETPFTVCINDLQEIARSNRLASEPPPHWESAPLSRDTQTLNVGLTPVGWTFWADDTAELLTYKRGSLSFGKAGVSYACYCPGFWQFV